MKILTILGILYHKILGKEPKTIVEQENESQIELIKTIERQHFYSTTGTLNFCIVAAFIEVVFDRIPRNIIKNSAKGRVVNNRLYSDIHRNYMRMGSLKSIEDKV